MVFIRWFHKLLLAVILAMVCQPAVAQTFMTKSGHAEFDSSVPLHSFTGTSDYLVGKISLADSTVDFYVDLNTLKTGIGKRDRDMLQTLEAEKHPFAEFFGKIVPPFDPASSDKQQVTVKGDFRVHGITNPVSIDGALQKTADGLSVTASWILNLEDYKIKPPGILFYRVDEEIKIRISATLPPQGQ